MIIDPYRYAVSEGSGNDSDVQAFLDASGITDETVIASLNTLVGSLKSESLWDKMIAIYPFCGGNATKNSYNLKNPAQYQITWAGAVTHYATGFDTDRSTGRGYTGITPSSHLDRHDVHFCVKTGYGYQIDGYEIGRDSNLFLSVRRGSNQLHAKIGSNQITVSSQTSGTGVYIMTRRGSNDFEVYKDGTSIGTNTSTDSGTLSNNTLLLAGNLTTGFSNGSERYNFFTTIGQKLSTSEAQALTTIINAF